VRPSIITETIEEQEEEQKTRVEKPTRNKSADAARRVRKEPTALVDKPKPSDKKKKQTDKENIPIENIPSQQPQPKSKMFIRPKSASQSTIRKPLKKNDPVSLYQAYQKDWEKFKPNICESSHSDLRWSIREKMMGNR
jgi:hydrolethalus syndrome protein 1